MWHTIWIILCSFFSYKVLVAIANYNFRFIFQSQNFFSEVFICLTQIKFPYRCLVLRVFFYFSLSLVFTDFLIYCILARGHSLQVIHNLTRKVLILFIFLRCTVLIPQMWYFSKLSMSLTEHLAEQTFSVTESMFQQG